MKLATLRKRSEYLRIRGGARWSGSAFVLEAKPRVASPDVSTAPAAARFGFTVTKQLGKAVVRNRIRRRLRALVAALAERHADQRYDYVLIARASAFDRSFVDLQKDLEQAFVRVHHPRAARTERSRRENKPERK